MTTKGADFKRMVLGLPRSPSDYAAVDAAAHLAELLQLDLLATFFADASLLGFAEIAGVRELRPFGHGWHPVDVVELTQDIERGAETARRLFAETVKTRGIEAKFDVARGSPADVLAALAQADDIVAVIEPKNPAERITQQFTSLIEAAFNASAAVLVVPSRLVRRTGPILAVASAADDSSIPAALAVAAALNERLIVLNAAGRPIPPGEIEEMTEASGVTIEQIVTSGIPRDASILVSALSGLKERLLVVTRGAFDGDFPQMLSSVLGIPVLVIEPGKATDVESERREHENRGGSGRAQADSP